MLGLEDQYTRHSAKSVRTQVNPNLFILIIMLGKVRTRIRRLRARRFQRKSVAFATKEAIPQNTAAKLKTNVSHLQDLIRAKAKARAKASHIQDLIRASHIQDLIRASIRASHIQLEPQNRKKNSKKPLFLKMSLWSLKKKKKNKKNKLNKN